MTSSPHQACKARPQPACPAQSHPHLFKKKKKRQIAFSQKSEQNKTLHYVFCLKSTNGFSPLFKTTNLASFACRAGALNIKHVQLLRASDTSLPVCPLAPCCCRGKQSSSARASSTTRQAHCPEPAAGTTSQAATQLTTDGSLMREGVRERNPTETCPGQSLCKLRTSFIPSSEVQSKRLAVWGGTVSLQQQQQHWVGRIAHKRLLPTLDWLFFSLCASSTTRQAHSIEPSTAWSMVISS